MNKPNPDTVIDLDTAKARVIERMAKAEQDADRQRVEAKRAADAQQRDAKESRERAAKLQADNETNRERRAALDAEGAKLVAALVATLHEREQLAAEHDARATRIRALLGTASPRWGDQTIDGERAAFARTLKATLAATRCAPGAFFGWLDHRAILFAQ